MVRYCRRCEKDTQHRLEIHNGDYNSYACEECGEDELTEDKFDGENVYNKYSDKYYRCKGCHDLLETETEHPKCPNRCCMRENALQQISMAQYEYEIDNYEMGLSAISEYEFCNPNH